MNTTLGAKRRVPEPVERGVCVPLFAAVGEEREDERNVRGHAFRYEVTSGDHVVARAVGLGAVVLRVRAVVVAREVALQGEDRSGCCRILRRVAKEGVIVPRSPTAAWFCPRRWTRRGSTGPPVT